MAGKSSIMSIYTGFPQNSVDFSLPCLMTPEATPKKIPLPQYSNPKNQEAKNTISIQDP
jgi:hypothetical protein